MHAEGALCPCAAHHHRPDGDPAVGRRVRLHGAALEHGDAAVVRRGHPGHRRRDRSAQGLSAGPRLYGTASHRPGPARPRGRFPAGHRDAADRTEAVLLAARPGAFGGGPQADRPAVLDRHGRPLEPGRDQDPARRRRDACLRATQCRLCVEFGNLPVVDGRHLAGADHGRDPVPAQSDPPDPAPHRSGRELRQRSRSAELPGRAAPRRCGAPPWRSSK